MIVFVVVSYMSMDVSKSFTIGLSANAALALVTILKSINNEPRPFHVADIKPTKCWLEFGNPSGHSLATTNLYFTFWDMLCRENGWTYKKASLKMKSSFAVAIVWILLVAFSRIYHGVHTINQILNGWIWGTCLYKLFCDILYDEI